ncbi:unnamed protein product [Cuscuta epithymum]|uniref:ZCF37 n=1 Tax=Cuscuta epithymum TaxID=186058 RepID=A0AAV0DH48_9ASTE|nr:unnamed protein product [Cuscuta epithymum]
MSHMFNPLFICGSSQAHEDLEDEMDCLSPKRSKKGNSNGKNNNPYANRGLDKFSALLAEIQDKKQKIYTQVGADEISIVRFVFSSNSNHVKPIVVKLKGGNTKKENTPARRSGESINNEDEVIKDVEKVKETGCCSKRKFTKTVSWKKMTLEDWKNPRFYMPLTIILILVFLAVYGRTFAILCTSVGWYAIPAIKEKRERPETVGRRKRKEYARGLSEKNVIVGMGGRPENSEIGSPSSPTSVLRSPSGNHHHRKSF